MSNLIFSFDIGYASIGWSVISGKGQHIEDANIIDTGVVLFPADDCLTSKRRQFRRMRRNIRSTRQRIQRLGTFLVANGVISTQDQTSLTHPAPYFLAARAIQEKQTLSPEELWHVIRWYAHNRGYDGNSTWAKSDTEDTKKEQDALVRMEEFDTPTACETICSYQQLNTELCEPNFTVTTPAYKKLNVAFPRHIVHAEVSKILQTYQQTHPALTQESIELILAQSPLEGTQRETLKTSGITRLPKRYHGGLLFGQLLPRFDNRIIKRCPITWAKVYQEALAKEVTEQQAKKQADKFAKVPNAHTPEFYRYRLARILANIRMNDEPLPAELRKTLMQIANERGSLSKRSIKEQIDILDANAHTNLDSYFSLHPDSKKALVLNPPLHATHSSSSLKKLWEFIPESSHKHITNLLYKGKSISYLDVKSMLEQRNQPIEPLVLYVQQEIINIEHTKKVKGKEVKFRISKEDAWNISPYKSDNHASGRAPYTRQVLNQVVDEVLAGFDPTRPMKSEKHPEGEDKSQDGVLYALQDPSSFVRKAEADRSIDSLTNNHKVRHRLLILERLLSQMVADFAQGNPDLVTKVVVEVGRELSEFSGKSAKQIEIELESRLADFNKAVARLQKDAPDLPITGGLIRKCRIAMDMDWKCPFTSKEYNAYDLPALEREHIVPYSARKTNALSALVLTFPEVNKMKSNRTALEFIEEEGGNQVLGKDNLQIMPQQAYRKFVENLKTEGHEQDKSRKKRRKQLLLVGKIKSSSNRTSKINAEEEESAADEMTAGLMTQSSQLMKLASRSIKATLKKATVEAIPGAITAEIRKAWNILGCLIPACEEALNPETKKVYEKTQLRKKTHLHHALDAITLALGSYYIPNFNNGRTWQLLAKRRLSPAEQKETSNYRIYSLHNAKPILNDLPNSIKSDISTALAHHRVVQHVPADYSGAMLDETIRGVIKIEGEGPDAIATTRQFKASDSKRKREIKTYKASKLMGVNPTSPDSKLKKIKGAIVISGNYGLALDPAPTIIRHVHVHKQLQDIRKANGEKRIRVLRNGMLINITKHKDPKRLGIWQIKSIKDNAGGAAVDLQRVQSALASTTTSSQNWINLRIILLIQSSFDILPENHYTGFSAND